MESSFTMFPRMWMDCEPGSNSNCSSGSELDTDTESGISICSSSASSISGSCEDFCRASRGGYDPNRKFTVVTYNILTDLCVKEGEYLYCPPENRYMTSRHIAIIAEIETLSPDIVCFQEVDCDHYRHRLLDSMRQLGYAGVLHNRLDDQGLAVFWKEKSFELKQQKHCLLHHLAETYIQMSDLTMAERAVIREAIQHPEAVLLVRLQHVVSGSQIAVANLHVMWKQLKYPALQALQTAVAVNELTDFSRGYDCCAQLICGDFNAPPNSISYTLMSRGQLGPNSLPEPLTSKLDDPIEGLRAFDLLQVLQPAFTLKIPFKSAYHTTLNAEPPITNCDEAGQSYRSELCLDYIWYCPDSLDVCGVLDLPPVEAILKHTALPSVDFPSDHLPLMAELVFK